MTINTKKAFVPLMEFLEANSSKKISSIIEEIREMTKQKNNLKTFVTNDKDEVVAIFCYYHKQWELVSEVDYGKKASSSTGLNTMCKVGVSKWTKQNNAVKTISETVLKLLESGEIKADEIADTKERLTALEKQIDDSDKPEGMDTIEEVFKLYPQSTKSA